MACENSVAGVNTFLKCFPASSVSLKKAGLISVEYICMPKQLHAPEVCLMQVKCVNFHLFHSIILFCFKCCPFQSYLPRYL